MASIIKKTSIFSEASKVDEKNKGVNGFESGFAGGGAEVENKDISSIKSNIPGNTTSVSIKKGDVAKYLSDNNIADAVLRVSFSKVDPYSAYVNARMFIQGSESKTNEISTFSGIFETDGGKAVPLIKKHLIGQPLKSLVSNLQKYNGVQAQVLNSAQFLDVRCLKESPVLDATEKWAYFFKEDSCGIPNPFNDLKNSIRYYYTTAEPDLAQSNPSQSLGGYVSPTQIYKESSLKGPVSFYDLVIETNDLELVSFSIIQIGDEILKVSEWNDSVATISKRNAFGTPIRFHPIGAKVIGVNSNDVFNRVMSKGNTQYRCFAIKNTNTTEIAKNVKVFFKLNSRNSLSSTRFAIEIPRSEEESGIADSGSATYLVDNDLAGVYENDHFKNASLTLDDGNNSGQSRIISSYTGSTGTFFFSNEFPNKIESGNSYTVGTSPSQLISSGKVEPLTGVSSTSSSPPFVIGKLQSATFSQNGVNIDIGGSFRRNGNDLYPGEVIYVWLERKIDNSNDFFVNNRMLFTIGFNS